MKYFYKNGTVTEWNPILASDLEMENRGLPLEERHVLYETDKPNNYKWVDGQVTEKTEEEKIAEGLIPLEDLKDEFTKKVNDICEKKILAGFSSSATGISRHYQSDRDDQTNLVGAVTASVDMLYKCGELIDGVIQYSFVDHTAVELKQVLLDGADLKSSYLQNAYVLKTLIADSSTQTELLSININNGW